MILLSILQEEKNRDSIHIYDKQKIGFEDEISDENLDLKVMCLEAVYDEGIEEPKILVTLYPPTTKF